VIAPAAILPNASCLPRTASMVELIPLYPRAARVGAEWRTKRIACGGSIPKTPAELPKNVPLRVTELRMLLIRSRIFDTASGLLAPSRKPHAPPRARPIEMRTCGQYKDNKMAR